MQNLKLSMIADVAEEMGYQNEAEFIRLKVIPRLNFFTGFERFDLADKILSKIALYEFAYKGHPCCSDCGNEIYQDSDHEDGCNFEIYFRRYYNQIEKENKQIT